MPSGEREATYYIRHRGRTTGPFPAGELAQFVRRGSVGRAHQISRDGRTWVNASAVPGLFGGAFDNAAAALPEPAAESSGAGPMVFYACGSDTFGPMPLPLLVSLVRAGNLPAGSQVWSSADPQRYPLHQHPLLLHVELPDTSAGPEGEAARPQSMGCGLVLIVVAGLCLAAGIYFAIDLSSADKDAKKTKKEPTTLRAMPPAASMPVDVPTTNPAAATTGPTKGPD